MVSTVKITINDSGMIKKLAKLNSSISQEAEETTRQIVNEGVNEARALAPKATGRMYKMIIPRFFKTKDGFRGMIVAQNPTKNPPREYRTVTRSRFPNGVFNLVYWAHNSTRAVRHFRSPGKHNFMDLARDKLQRRKQKYGDLMKQKIIKRNK